MLVTVTADTLALIIPVKIASQQFFDLIEVPLTQILNSGPDSMDKTKAQESRLQLTIDANGIILKNGKRQSPRNLIICLVSEEDLTDLGTRTKNIVYGPDQATRRPVGRRPSSIFIPLDTGDEVAEKTLQYETEPGVSAGDSRPQPPATMQNGSALTTQVVKSDLVVGPTVNHGTHDAEPRDSKAAKADIEVSQSGQKKQRTSLAKKKTGLPSNTQEPLQLSRLRNVKRKVYTPNDEVDWDEDLRPTDDSQEADEKDADFTSISSPLPSGSPALKRRAGAAKKKGKSGANSNAGSSKKPTQKSKPKARKSKTKGTSKNSRLPLLPRGSSADNESQNAVSAEKIKMCSAKDDKNTHDPTHNGDGNNEEKRPGKTLEFQACHTLPTGSVSPYRSEDAPANGEDFDPFKNLDLVSEASVFPKALWDPSNAWLTQVDGNFNGDIRDFPEENKLDWETHARKKVKPKGQTKSHGGTGKTLGKKLAAALLDSGILSDDPPSEEDRSSSHHISVGESKQCKPSEVSNPPQEVQRPTPRPDQQSTLEGRGRFESRQIESKESVIDVLPGTSAVVTALEANYPGERGSVAMDQANTCSTNKFGKGKVLASSISRKRAASQERKAEKRSKKHQADPDPEYQPPKPNESSQLPQRNIQSSKEGGTFDQGCLDMETSSWATTEYGDSTSDAGNMQLELHLHPPRADLEPSTASGSPRTPVRNKYATRKQKSLPKAIVDENGSPRLRVRKSPDSQQRFEPMGKWHGQLGQRCSVEQARGNRVCESESDTEYYPSKICTFRSRVLVHFGEDLLGAKCKGPGDSKSEDSTSIASVEQPLSTAGGLGGFPAESLHGYDSPIAISTSASSSEEEMETGTEQTRKGYELVASQSPSIANPVQLGSELAQLNGRIDGDDMATKWQTTLQAIQQTTDDVLANTSKVSEVTSA